MKKLNSVFCTCWHFPRFFALLLFLSIYFPLFSQSPQEEPCRTKGGPALVPNFSQGVVNTDPKHLRMFVYLIRDPNGWGITKAAAEQSLAEVDSYFAEHNIFFEKVCFIEAYDAALRVDCYAFWGNHPYRRDDAINLYLMRNEGVGANAASGVVGNCAHVMASENGVPMSQIIAHELGHCLGLLHTHHDGFLDPSECNVEQPHGFNNTCPELVDGSNSDLCGDQITDTPADPGGNDFTICPWTGNQTDANSQLYNPDETNLMSYYSVSCIDEFTPLQGERMHSRIATQPVLYNCLINPSLPVGVTVTASTTWTAANVPNGGHIGSLVVKSGVALTIESGVTLRFESNGSLLIENGAVVWLKGTLTNSLCSPTWKGVMVRGTGISPSSTQFPTNGINPQGAIFTFPGAEIKNAEVGISAFDPSIPNSSGGIVLCSGTTFRNNKIGVEINPFVNHNQNFIGDYYGQFSGCTFINDENYPVDLRPFYAFADIDGVRGIRFNGCNFNNASHDLIDGETIERWGYGIKSLDSRFLVKPLCGPDGTNCTDCVFYGLGYGIHATRSISFETFQVTGAIFDVCYIGIFNRSIDFAEVNYCQFRLNKVPGPAIQKAQIGILANIGIVSFSIEENWFGKYYEINNPFALIGTSFYNTGNLSIIRRNTFEGLNIGNLANRNNRDFNTGLGLLYLCNNSSNQGTFLYNGSFDFAVTNNSTIDPIQWGGGISANSFRGAGNIFTHAGNPASDFRNDGPLNIEYYYPENIPEQEPLFFSPLSFTKIKDNVQVNTCDIDYFYPYALKDEGGDIRLSFDSHKTALENLLLQPSTDENIRQQRYHQQEIYHYAERIIKDMMADSVTFDKSAALNFLLELDDYSTDRAVAAEYYNMGEVEQGKTIFDNCPSKYNLTNQEVVELNNFISVLELGITDNNQFLSTSEQTLLLSYTSSDGIEGGLARGILERYRYEFPPLYELPEEIEERVERLGVATNTLFSASPNPTTGLLSLTYNGDIIERVEVYGMDGKSKVSLQTNFTKEATISLDLSHLSNGLYMVNVITQNGRTAVRKINVIK